MVNGAEIVLRPYIVLFNPDSVTTPEPDNVPSTVRSPDTPRVLNEVERVAFELMLKSPVNAGSDKLQLPPEPVKVIAPKVFPAEVIVLPADVDTKLTTDVLSAGRYVIPATNTRDPAVALPTDNVTPVLCVRVPV